MWRTGRDIQPTWGSVLRNAHTVAAHGHVAGPGAWNDPDFLEVGVGDFAFDGSKRVLEMNRAHFALWCVRPVGVLLLRKRRASSTQYIVTFNMALELFRRFLHMSRT